MRWPWISRDTHEDIVRDLRMRLADSELERKKAQDEMLRLLGGKPYNFPQAEVQTSVTAEEGDESDREAEWLEYLKVNRPAQFPQALASIMSRRPMGTVPPRPKPQDPATTEKKAAVVSAFDQAETEVKQKINGHAATA